MKRTTIMKPSILISIYIVSSILMLAATYDDKSSLCNSIRSITLSTFAVIYFVKKYNKEKKQKEKSI